MSPRTLVDPRARKRHTHHPLVHWTLTLCAAAIVIAAARASAAEPTVLKLWDHHIHDKKFRQNIFKEFNRENPDIKVEYTSQVATTYQTVLDAAFRAGTPPDIFFPNIAGGLPKLIEMGWIVPLDEVAPSTEELRAWKEKFPQQLVPFVEKINVFGGKTYSWPNGSEGGRMMLFTNTKLFEDAGLPAAPETWDEMRAAAKRITELGQGKVYGIVHGIKDPHIWVQDISWSLAIAAGWPWYGLDYRTGHFDFTSPAFKGAIQLWLDMKNDGSVFPGDLSMDDEQSKFRFTQDVAGMIFTGPWAPGGFLAVNPDLTFDTFLPPTPKRGERKGYIPVGAVAETSEYVVSSRIKDRQAAWRVIQFMTSERYQEEWVKAGGGTSVFPQYNKPEFFPHPTIAKIAEMAITGRRTGNPMFLFSDGANKAWSIYGGMVEAQRPHYLDLITALWIGEVGWDAFDRHQKAQDAWLDQAIAEANKEGFKVTRADFVFPDWDPAENYPPPKRK